MKLRILDLAEADLLSGFRFYERRAGASVGTSWIPFRQISNLCTCMPEFTASISDIFACCPVVFHTPSTPESSVMRSKCGGFWIADAIRIGFVDNSAGIKLEVSRVPALSKHCTQLPPWPCFRVKQLRL